MAGVQKPKTAILTFVSEDGKNVTMSINPVKAGLTQADLEACMDTIIEQNCFVSKSGNLVGKVKAQIVDVTVEEFDYNN